MYQITLVAVVKCTLEMSIHGTCRIIESLFIVELKILFNVLQQANCFGEFR